MSKVSIGDLSQNFKSIRQGFTIKSDLANLSSSLSSGRVTDIPKELNGQTARLNGLNYSREQLDVLQDISKETMLMLDSIQSVLVRVDDKRAELMSRLFTINDSSSQDQVALTSQAARQALDDMVSALNTKVGGRALFSGRDVNEVPLIPASQIVSEIVAAIGTDQSIANMERAIEDWFTGASSGATATVYRGDTSGFMKRRISPDKEITIELTANSEKISETLKQTVRSAVLLDLTEMTPSDKISTIKSSSVSLFNASADLANTQAMIGSLQEAVTTAQVEMKARDVSFEIAVNDLIAADPFETASRLQSAQLQLEKHYTVVARMSQLSLLRFI